MSGGWRTICVAPAAVIVLFAAYSAVKEAYAERLYSSGNRGRVETATKVRPERALFWSGLAESADRAGEDPLPAMRRAAAMSPRDSSLRIRLGLRAEANGNLPEAERELLEAARLSRKYAPRWTLANFYYRRRNADGFWHWTREALMTSYGDRRPLFDLCATFSSRPAEILERAIPERRPVLMDFASYLSSKNEDRISDALVIKLAADAVVEETGYFLHHTDRLLDSWRVEGALAVWNLLCSRRLVPYRPLAPGSASVVTNGDFGETRLSQGFDWRTPGTPGVFVAPIPAQGWRVWLNGGQPEQCELLSQFLPVERGRTYLMKHRYRAAAGTATDGGATGVRWVVFDRGGKELGSSELALSDEAKEDNFTFCLANVEQGARLALTHRRPAGSPRFEGEIRLEQLSIEMPR